MLILNANNQFVELKNADNRIIHLLLEVTSYKVKGAQFSRSWKRKHWKGVKKLLVYKRNVGYKFPTGLLCDVLRVLKENKIKHKLELNRRSPEHYGQVSVDWNDDIRLREYQKKAVKAITENGPYKGSGIIKMPIRSGKTKTAAAIIQKLGVTTLFIVPSKSLLYQTQESLSESLLCDVGIVGDGNWEEMDITVATAQTLSKARTEKKKRWFDLTEKYGCVIFDEAHHLTANTWHDTMMAFNSPYKIGLSATAFPDRESEWEKGAIWLKACCGEIKIDIPTSHLIEKGFLTIPKVKLYRITEPCLKGDAWSAELRNLGIYENEFRNKKIVKIAKRFVEKDKLVLIVTNRLNQVKRISELLEKQNLGYHTVTSVDSIQERKWKVEDFVNHETQILVGTVLSEGVDIPEIDVVINAEGGADPKSTIQKMRNLTISTGKARAYVIDFIDLTNGYFAEHSKKRLEIYRNEPAFELSVHK